MNTTNFNYDIPPVIIDAVEDIVLFFTENDERVNSPRGALNAALKAYTAGRAGKDHREQVYSARVTMATRGRNKKWIAATPWEHDLQAMRRVVAWCDYISSTTNILGLSSDAINPRLSSFRSRMGRAGQAPVRLRIPDEQLSVSLWLARTPVARVYEQLEIDRGEELWQLGQRWSEQNEPPKEV